MNSYSGNDRNQSCIEISFVFMDIYACFIITASYFVFRHCCQRSLGGILENMHSLCMIKPYLRA